jgi:hypothetical protein
MLKSGVGYQEPSAKRKTKPRKDETMNVFFRVFVFQSRFDFCDPSCFRRFVMKAISMVFVVLVIGLASGTLRAGEAPSEGRSEAGPKWEYRVLTKQEILDLGKKDLTAGLNKLGDQGWELAAVETSFIFKRAKPSLSLQGWDPIRRGERIEDVKRRIALLEADLEMWKDRVAWAERMLKKGFLSEAQVKGERLEMKKTEITLDYLQKELQGLSPDAKGPPPDKNPSGQPEPIKAPKRLPPP